MSAKDTSDEEVPPGWITEEASDDVHSWLGSDERVLCTRVADDADAWIAYIQPRGELATSTQVPLFETPICLAEALSAAREYMSRYSESE